MSDFSYMLYQREYKKFGLSARTGNALVNNFALDNSEWGKVAPEILIPQLLKRFNTNKHSKYLYGIGSKGFAELEKAVEKL